MPRYRHTRTNGSATMIRCFFYSLLILTHLLYLLSLLRIAIWVWLLWSRWRCETGFWRTFRWRLARLGERTLLLLPASWLGLTLSGMLLGLVDFLTFFTRKL